MASTSNDCSGLVGILHQLMRHEHCYVHDILVSSRKAQRTTAVVTVKDHEPGSGSYHQLAWSKDSNALLIYGVAGLPDAGAEDKELCLVYEPADDKLYEFSDCPTPKEQGEIAECRRTTGCG